MNSRQGVNKLVCAVIALMAFKATLADTRVWLDEMDVSAMTSGWAKPQVNKSLDGNALSVGGKSLGRGIGTHALSSYEVYADGNATGFDALVGVDDEKGSSAKASVKFIVRADGNKVAESPILRGGDKPYALHADLSGAKVVELFVCHAKDGIEDDHADWGEAYFTVVDGKKIEPHILPCEQLGILTPKASPVPSVNGPKVYGARPGHPIIYRLPVSGEKPLEISVDNLPEGLSFDAAKGIITGSVAKRGDYTLKITAKNKHGAASRDFTLKIGDKIALTPALGWNSWNCFCGRVTAEDIRNTADAFDKSGLAEHGWAFVNIDDFWQNAAKETSDPTLQGVKRNADGTINPNVRFPDMKGLVDYVHSLGFKIGIYSSPGPWTCGGNLGSWQHEWQDAKSWADWGFDYVKYDLCGYRDVPGGGDSSNLEWNSMPFRIMGEALAAQERDIVYSLCQYGWANVQTWGANVGGNSWRTTGDIEDTWKSMSTILEAQADLWPYAGPGAWNDPDMLIVGPLGWGDIHPTRLTPNEQYTHVSFWCMLCSPMLIGCDLTQIDEFTMSLLTNDEVLETNQDPLGAAAARVQQCGDKEVWAKPMSDGSIVMALYNKGRKDVTIKVDMKALGMEGEWRVRDLWRQKDIGSAELKYETLVYPHATTLLRFYPTASAKLTRRDIRDNATRLKLEKVRSSAAGGDTSKPCQGCD